MENRQALQIEMETNSLSNWDALQGNLMHENAMLYDQCNLLVLDKSSSLSRSVTDNIACIAVEAMDKDTVLYEQCSVLFPAAIGNVITSDNASKLNCQFVVEAANGPTTPNVSSQAFTDIVHRAYCLAAHASTATQCIQSFVESTYSTLPLAALSATNGTIGHS